MNGSTDDQRGNTAYLRAFGPQRFAGTPGFGGASPDGYNSFHVMTAANRDWLILALDWRASGGRSAGHPGEREVRLHDRAVPQAA